MAAPSRALWLATLTLAAMVAGFVVVARGFLAVPGPFQLPWGPGALVPVLGLLLAILAAMALVSRLWRMSIVPAATVVAVAGLTLVGAFWPVAVVGTMALAFALVGRRFRGWWRDRADDPLLDVVVGAGVFATLVGVLAHFPVNGTPLYALLLAAPIVWQRREALALLRLAGSGFAPSASVSPLAAYPAAALSILYSVVALFPETGWDAMAMHLFIPGHVAAHGSWSFDPQRFAWALMPALGDWLFTIAYLFDGERGARMLNAASTIAGAALVYRIAVTCGARAAWAWTSAALWLATPVVFTVGASLFIDAPWTMLVLAGLAALMRAPVPGQPPYAWITGGALLGFAAAAKAVTLPMLPVIAIFALAQWRTWRVPGGNRVLAWAALAFVVAACKPYLYAWLATGNPVYPFFVHVFGGPPELGWQAGPQRYREPLSLQTPYDATFASDRYLEGRSLGSPGFQWLILLPAAAVALVLSAHRRGLMLLALGVATLASVFAFQGYLRYVLPSLALLVAAFAVAGSALGDRAPRVARVFAAAMLVVLALNLAHLCAAGFHDALPFRTILDAQARRDYLLHRSPTISATQFATQLPTMGSRLAMFSTPALAAAPGVDIVHASWYTPPFLRAVRSATSPESLARTLAQWRVRYVIVDGWWSNPEQRQRLEAATTLVAAFDGAAVREVRREFAFEHEYLRNGSLESADGWALIGNARHDAAARVLRVTVESPAYQSVPVQPGSLYRNTVRARCTGAGQARMQVNWLDARSAFVSTSLQTFACGEGWTEKVQEVVAPRTARLGIVYATSADGNPVEIGGVSFRGSRP